MPKRVILFVLLVAVLLAALVYSQVRTEPFHVSGFIESDDIRVGSRIGGRVKTVYAVEGATVTKDEPLVELDPFDLKERQSQARADLAARQADLARLEAGFRIEEIGQAEARYQQLEANLTKLINGPRPEEIAAARARLRLAQAESELAQVRHRRVEAAYKSKAATPGEVDQAVKELSTTAEMVNVRRDELELLIKGTREEEINEAKAKLAEAKQALQLEKNGYRREERDQAKAAVDAAQAALAVIEQQLDELIVRAPEKATVEAVDLQPGDLVPANAPVISLLLTQPLWVRAYVPENDLGIKLDQKVFVTVDSFPSERFAAHISFIARQAEFTPGNVQTPEERSKQVFRIKVHLDEGLDRLRAGMAADVWFE